VTPAGYAAMTARVQQLAAGRVVLALEGGYNLSAISRCAEACLRALLGDEIEEAAAGPVSPLAERVLTAVLRTQSPYWPDLVSPGQP
jgi:histone deacetylase 6